MKSGLLGAHARVAHDDHLVARGNAPRCGAVQADHAAARLSRNRIRLKACAVHDVNDLNLLVLEDAARPQKVGVHRDRADVVKLGLRDGRPVDLGLEHLKLHERPPS